MSFDDFRPAGVAPRSGGGVKSTLSTVEGGSGPALADVSPGTMIDVRRIVPPGVQFDLLMVAFHKYALATVAMSHAERLEILEAISGYFPKAVTAAIEPCTPATAKVICEALDLPPEHSWRKLSQGYEIRVREPVWSKLLGLNPSLSKAIDLLSGCGAPAAAV